MKASTSNLGIKERFDAEKQTTLTSAETYLNNNQSKPIAPSADDIKNERDNITKLVNKGKFEEALLSLEKLRDAKSGITQTLIPNDQGAPTLIRDARSGLIPAVRQTESFEMQYLNAIRAGMDLAEGKPELQAVLLEKAKVFFGEDGFHKKTHLSQKQLGKEELKAEIKNIGVLLGENGISKAYTKLNVAKDFQNFKDKHSNVITVSTINNAGKSHTVIEAEVAMKGLTKEQQSQYNAIISPNKMIPKPSWYEAMPKWEQDLCKKYAPIIAKGEHVMPTQLRQMVGMKNAFEKTTAIYEPDKSKLEVLHTSKHAGALASLARDKGVRQNITDLNAKQAQEWVGNKSKLHCNTFNSGPIGAGDDPTIVKQTTKSMKNVGGKETNTAFNAFRIFGASSDFTGAKNTLADISKSLQLDDKASKVIKSYLEPKGFLGRMMRRGNPEDAIHTLEAAGKIDAQTRDILLNAVELRQKVEQADKLFRIGDTENLSLQVSTTLNSLSQKIANIPSDAQLTGMNKDKLPREEILNMCASGKDRTGLAEHDQSAQAIAKRIKADVKDIDGQLLRGGHTAQQAGGIHAGGATIGCYGTKSENRAGLPKSRKKDLENIIEESANSNKIKGDSKKFDKIIEQEIKSNGAKPLPVKKNKVTFKETIAEVIPQKTEPVITKQQQEAAKTIGDTIPPSMKKANSANKEALVQKKVATIAAQRSAKGNNQISK